jgi:hypothetical protein
MNVTALHTQVDIMHRRETLELLGQLPGFQNNVRHRVSSVFYAIELGTPAEIIIVGQHPHLLASLADKHQTLSSSTPPI